MIKAVLDTNTIVSALIKKDGKPAQILARRREFQVVLSEPILTEVLRVLHYPRLRKKYPYTEDEIALFCASLIDISDVVVVKHMENAVPRDPTDNAIIATAKAGDEECVVSGDQDLTDLEEYQGIRIVTPAQFLEVLSRQDAASLSPNAGDPDV